MKWIDNIAEHANKSVKEKRKHEPRPPVQEVVISVRPSSDNRDPGECAIGHFIVQGDTVVLTNERGDPLDGENITAKLDGDPKRIAGRLTRAQWEASRAGGDFNRRLDYPKMGWM